MNRLVLPWSPAEISEVTTCSVWRAIVHRYRIERNGYDRFRLETLYLRRLKIAWAHFRRTRDLRYRLGPWRLPR